MPEASHGFVACERLYPEENVSTVGSPGKVEERDPARIHAATPLLLTQTLERRCSLGDFGDVLVQPAEHPYLI